MAMIEVNTSDLIGPALDWAVAYHLNGEPVFFEAFGARMLGRSITTEVAKGNISPSTNWAQGGPLIDKYDPEENGTVGRLRYAEVWIDLPDGGAKMGNATGETRLIAACRAIVAAKIGETVKVPAELMPKAEK